MSKGINLPGGFRWLAGFLLVLILGVGCSASTPMASTQIVSEVPLGSNATATQPMLTTPTIDPLILTPSATLVTQPTVLPTQAIPSPTATATAATTIIPPRFGIFDVYLGAPDDDGKQLIQWIEEGSGVAITQVEIAAIDQQAIRAGQFVYFVTAETNKLTRINTGGNLETLTFASPTPDTAFYDYALSATGNYLAWVIVKQSGEYTINLSDIEGAQARTLASGTAAPGDQLRLLRVANDGQKLYYDHLPATVTRQTLFRGLYSLSMIDVVSGQNVVLPNEPACGEIFVCDAHISPDGAFLIRTLPPTRYRQPIVVTNLVTSVILRQFAPPDADTVFPVDVGYPFFTPGGEMVYVEAYGPTGIESYRLIWANIVTGDQRIVAELGAAPHRPLGWVANGAKLLTTREKGWYDTWQIDIMTGEMRQIAGLMFLGHIEEPPRQP